MLNIKNKTKFFSGFTLIEALAVLFIFSLITITFYQVISLGTRYMQNSKNRLGALAVASGKMEVVRNLEYDNIGTDTGSVSGIITQEEYVTGNAKQYKVETFIEFEDDPFDGQYPADTIWGDYKKVTIVVSWDGADGNSEEVRLISRFVPPGLEVDAPGDGVLSINIFSDQPGGTGIPNSKVRVINSETGLDTGELLTDASGNIVLIGDKIGESVYKYEIFVEKSGYETVNTLPPYPNSAYNPLYPHGSVISGLVNVTNIVQNELADLQITTEDYLGQSTSGVGFHLSGGKQIGTEAFDPLDLTPNEPIYNFSSDSSTDSDGEKTFGGISPGQFEIFLDSSAQNDYEIIGTDPPSPYEENVSGDEVYFFSLHSEPPLVFEIKLADKNTTSILVSALQNEDGSPISGATVKLSNGEGYSAEKITPVDGKAFFPENGDTFSSGIYSLEITADGFSGSNSEVTINEGELKIKTVELNDS